jgi:peptidoglycan/LPS O-acetylase OafA/YrhL
MLAVFVLLEFGKLGYGRADPSLPMYVQPFAEGHTVWEIVTNVLFLQSFGLHPGLSWNGPAWSAAVEFYVSALFAAVILLFPRGHRAVFLGLSLAGGGLLYLISPRLLFVASDWGVLRAIFSFFAGCLAYDLRARFAHRLPAPTLLEAGCLVLAIAFIATTSGAWHYAFPLIAGITIFVFSFEQGAVSGVLRSSMLQKLGLWSYSIYMVHDLVFQLMRSGVAVIGHKANLDLMTWHNNEKMMVMGTHDQALLIAVLALVPVVPVAYLTYRFIEKPAMDAAREMLRGQGTGRDATTLAGSRTMAVASSNE